MRVNITNFKSRVKGRQLKMRKEKLKIIIKYASFNYANIVHKRGEFQISHSNSAFVKQHSKIHENKKYVRNRI